MYGKDPNELDEDQEYSKIMARLDRITQLLVRILGRNESNDNGGDIYNMRKSA